MHSLKTAKKRRTKNLGRTARDLLPSVPPEIQKKKKRILQHKKAKKKGGRPPIVTPDKVSKLEAAFTNDFTVEEALDYAGISRASFYRWQKDNEEFRDRMRRAQQYPLTLAKRAVIGQLKGDAEHRPDGQLGLRFLERRQPERYRPRIDPEDIPIPPMTIILPGSKEHPRFKAQKK